MCRKKPIDDVRAGAARSASGTSISWKSCTQTRQPGVQCPAIVVGEALVDLDVASPTPRCEKLNRPAK